MSSPSLSCQNANETRIEITSDLSAPETALAWQKSLLKITNRIRRSLDWSIICETTTAEVRELLRADRVAIYRFNPDWSGSFVFESVESPWRSLVEAQTHNPLISQNVNECSIKMLDKYTTTDTYLQKTQSSSFSERELFRVCTDTHSAGFSDCYVEVLESYQARAYTIVAIYVDQKLWGLLAAYQNSGPRNWHQNEVQLMVHVAEQLGIALKQAEYVQTIEQQSHKLKDAIKKIKQSQLQLIQSEKMASLGQLVAGIAHEINNPVNFIYANLAYVDRYTTDLLNFVNLSMQLAEPSSNSCITPTTLLEKAQEIELDFIQEDFPKTLNSMKIGAERIQKIVLSLRNFSRLDESDVKVTDLHEGINSTLLILAHRLKATDDRSAIEVIKNYSDIPPIKCYPAQLNQVFMNLLANAIDALEDAIRIGKLEAKNPEKSQQPTIWITTQQANKMVAIRIRDNGIGLPKNNQTKIFDHFFTTKDVGKGTGLGLSISKRIIEETHHGKLYAQATEQQGIEFVIELAI